MYRLHRQILAFCIATLVMTTHVFGQVSEEHSVRNATAVLDDVMVIPSKQIPQRLLSQARGVVIVPRVMKGGFVVGVRKGNGVALVKDDYGNWLAPVFVTLTGGSIGWQGTRPGERGSCGGPGLYFQSEHFGMGCVSCYVHGGNVS